MATMQETTEISPKYIAAWSEAMLPSNFEGDFDFRDFAVKINFRGNQLRGIVKIDNFHGHRCFGAGNLSIPVTTERDSTPLFREMAEANKQVLTATGTAGQWQQLDQEYNSSKGEFCFTNEGSPTGGNLRYWRRYLSNISERKVDHHEGAKIALMKGLQDFLTGLKKVVPDMKVLPSRLTSGN